MNGESQSADPEARPGKWVDLLSQHSLPPSGISGHSVGDLDLVVWRTAAGRLVAMEARCPHQWSHLEAEGVVDGEDIVCTAHFWRFDAAGQGSKVNVKGRRDPKGDIAVYPVREVDGRIEVRIGH